MSEMQTRNLRVEGRTLSISLILSKPSPTVISRLWMLCGHSWPYRPCRAAARWCWFPLGRSLMLREGVIEKPFGSTVSLKNICVQRETPTCLFKSAFGSFCITKIAQNIFTSSSCPKNLYGHQECQMNWNLEPAEDRIINRQNVLTLNFTFFISLIFLHRIFLFLNQVESMWLPVQTRSFFPSDFHV